MDNGFKLRPLHDLDCDDELKKEFVFLMKKYHNSLQKEPEVLSDFLPPLFVGEQILDFLRKHNFIAPKQ